MDNVKAAQLEYEKAQLIYDLIKAKELDALKILTHYRVRYFQLLREQGNTDAPKIH